MEPVEAKFPEFLGGYVDDGVLVSTIGLSPAESGCFSLSPVVSLQENRKTAFTGKEDPALAKTQTAICALLDALRWDHPKERDLDTRLMSWAPRTIIYPMEIADLIGKITPGHSNLIPDELVGVCGEFETVISARERNATFKIMSYERRSRKVR
jgi:hypothetical protein